MTPEARGRLQDWLSRTLGAEAVIAAASRLSGGAIQENWLVEASIDGLPRAFVLRRDAAATISASHDRATEFAVIRAARAAGVLVPEPVAFCAEAAVIGAPFALMGKAEGVGFGPRIVKDVTFGGDREALTRELGRQLAVIHAVSPPHEGLAMLPAPPDDQALADIAWLRAAVDAMGAARPALEWALRWAERHAPPAVEPRFIHRDFRTGNYMVDARGLTAILDWEFADWGDPASDIGWFCAACWRFGRPDLEAGGVGSRAAFLDGYATGGGALPEPGRVAFWEVMAHLRWAVIALQQGARHASGREMSLEHALTGRMAAELELAALLMTAPERWRAA